MDIVWILGRISYDKFGGNGKFGRISCLFSLTFKIFPVSVSIQMPSNHGSYEQTIMHETYGRPDGNGFQLK